MHRRPIELDQLYFRVAELENAQVEADPDLQPIIVMTSNSEKDLPDAFLRRCIFYHIPFPDLERMKAIVSSRLGMFSAGSSEFLSQALELFYRLRRRDFLRKAPATAELLDWLGALVDSSPGTENPLRADPRAAVRTIASLVKRPEDVEKATKLIERWLTDGNEG